MPRRQAPFTPPAVLFLLYASLVVLGTLLLKLPMATQEPISWLEAAFSATSAVTITGLSVVATGEGFTLFGQAVLLALIQLGGLGIMTFTVLVLTVFGLPVGLRQRIVLSQDLNTTSFGDLFDLVKLIVRFVLVAELAGALLLAFRFVPDFGWKAGLWAALFHAVSAFNNAGFSTFSKSLEAWVGDPVVNLVMPALFILGGLGFTVVLDLWRVRAWRGLGLHSKLMISGTAALIVVSVAATAALEWWNPGTLAGLSTPDKIMAAWFQATTTRTAGFNSVPIEELRESTSVLFMALMLIGGGSTSTAGGIKVTTFVVLLIATIGFIRGEERIHAFDRELGEPEILKVLALAVAGGSLLLVAVFLLVATQDGRLLDLAFEAASALGTVGLSRGATGDLDWLGQILVMVLMFAGRVGPLAFGFVLARRGLPLLRYPPGRVYLG